jgi:hypothetical protein
MSRAKKNFIQGMNLKKGALHKSLHVPMDKNIPEAKIEKAEHSRNPKLARRARMAQTLKHLSHRGQK